VKSPTSLDRSRGWRGSRCRRARAAPRASFVGHREDLIEAVKHGLPIVDFEAYWNAGGTMTPGQAIAEALVDPETSPGDRSVGSS
jgi:hypothetical protein